MNAGFDVTDDDLQAYADDALSPARRAEVAAYLEKQPEAAARVKKNAEQNAMLRAAAANLLETEVPADMKVARLFERKRGRLGLLFQTPPAMTWPGIAAAFACVFVLGNVSGWSLHPVSNEFHGGIRPLVEEAADTYAVYEPDRLHPVEVSATHRDDLMAWVAARLRRSISAPAAIAGYRLLGGRVVATSRGPAAMFMYYDDHGTRIIMMVCPLSLHGTADITDSEQSGLAGVSWSDEGIGYSLVGAIPASSLHELGEAARREINDKV